MNFPLLFHNILFLFGTLVSIGTAFFVMLATQRSRSVTTFTFALSCLAVAVFQLSHLLGINAPDAVTSRMILMFNLVDFFIGIFMTHWFLGFIGKIHQQRYALMAVYVSGISLFTFFLFFPRAFLIESVPKLYFPFYYQPGPLYFVMVLWLIIVSIYHFYQLIQAYRTEPVGSVQKNRFKYVLLAMLYAYAFGTTAFLLVFDIPLNPALSALFGLYPLLIVYAILQYEVFDIHVFAKRAFVYASTILGIGLVITLTDFLSNYFITIQPAIPRGVVPVVASIVLASGALYVWRKAREADVAKYEFITVVTHKFRTPLTRIKWATEEIEKILPSDKKEMTSIVHQSERQLFELTNMLVRLSEADSDGFEHAPESIDISVVLRQLEAEYVVPMEQKNVTFSVERTDHVFVMGNQEQLHFILQILLDNAMSYTPEGGAIMVTSKVFVQSSEYRIQVRDTGIGMAKHTLRQIFSRFYRGEKARLADTEGMGIGLFMAKNLIAKQGGKIWAESPGENKGSAFTISIPLDIEKKHTQS